jgi:hypothetical protein
MGATKVRYSEGISAMASVAAGKEACDSAGHKR